MDGSLASSPELAGGWSRPFPARGQGERQTGWWLMAGDTACLADNAERPLRLRAQMVIGCLLGATARWRVAVVAGVATTGTGPHGRLLLIAAGSAR